MYDDRIPEMTFGQFLVTVDRYMYAEYPDAVQFINDASPMIQQQACSIIWQAFLSQCPPQECCGRVASLGRQNCTTSEDA